jgi:flotillin
MAVERVKTVQEAEINRDANIVFAEQQKQVTIKQAEAAKQQVVLQAEANLETQTKAAEGRRLVGEAEGAALYASEMAPVNAQIALAKEIGENQGYQTYLVTLKQIEAGQAVGTEAAKALEKAGIKIIATAGTPAEGMKSVMDAMTPAGAAKIGAALETLGNMPAVQQLLGAIKPNGAASGTGLPS